MNTPCHTRFAPSPTGRLHLGGARTAIFSWLLARTTGGTFTLRVDDTDPVRSRPEYLDDIKSGLEWLGLDWDREFHQSDRRERYDVAARTLISNGSAIRGDDGAVCLSIGVDNVPVESWEDAVVGRVPVSKTDCEYIARACIVRASGDPLYNLCSTVDDHELGINYIVRGVDHVTNTSLQEVIRVLLGGELDATRYAHVGLIHGADGRKMSKRAGVEDFFLSHYRSAGYSPEAMFAMLVRLGWAPRLDNKENSLVTKEKAMELFLTEGRMRSAPAKFDAVKLDSIQRKLKAQKS